MPTRKSVVPCMQLRRTVRPPFEVRSGTKATVYKSALFFRNYPAVGLEWLLHHLDQAQVSISRDDDGIVEATFPFNKSATSVSHGKVCFDLNRKGLPSRYLVKIFNRAGDRTEPNPISTLEMIVDKAEETNGIWVPTRA